MILAVSEKLVNAAPDIFLREFAQRLCSLYLLEDRVIPDTIYTDELFLEKPSVDRTTWKWLAGVNVFCAGADRRWWQDHRIPGGIGFSVNSVGHLVKSGQINGALRDLDSILGLEPTAPSPTKVDSLSKALEFAMRTIDGASDAVSGRATELVPLPQDPAALPVTACPAQLPRFLEGKNFCEYSGYYHTDITIPSSYFRLEAARPNDIQPLSLDFTYLFRDHVDNPSFQTMGAGRQIRNRIAARPDKAELWQESEMQIEASDRLIEALR